MESSGSGIARLYQHTRVHGRTTNLYSKEASDSIQPPIAEERKKLLFFSFRPPIVAHFYTGGDVVIFIHVFRVCVWDEPWFLVYSFFFFLALLLRQQPVTSLHFLLLHYQLLPMGRKRNILRKSDAQVFSSARNFPFFQIKISNVLGNKKKDERAVNSEIHHHHQRIGNIRWPAAEILFWFFSFGILKSCTTTKPKAKKSFF